MRMTINSKDMAVDWVDEEKLHEKRQLLEQALAMLERLD